jgi:antagonist of KipI
VTLIIRKPGLLTTIQDLGRTGGRRFGINPGGVMDRSAARVTNILLDNPESASVLEMHFPAPEIEFTADTVFAIGGADLGAELDGKPCRNWSVSLGTPGDVLKFRQKISGQRAYIAVTAGFAADEWLGSRSTNMVAGVGGNSGRALVSGDELKCVTGTSFARPVTAGNSLMFRSGAPSRIRVIAGPEFHLLTAMAERSFVTGAFSLTTDCDRMGYRLSGEPLHLLHEREMISSGVTFGTIQLLPDGQLIVLMADHQTSGGYPRIANVVSVDLPALAQCGPGDQIRFEFVSIVEAERLALRFEHELNFLRVGCRLQTQNANR